MRWVPHWQGLWRRQLLAAVGLGGVVATVYGAWVVLTLPDIRLLAQANPAVTGYMAFREATREPQVRDAWVPLEDISPALACNVVRSEDAFFFRHGGVDWRQALWAGGQFLMGRSRVGTSTITQQLARNLYLTPERSLDRKFREVLIAIGLERHLSKARILELYLNVVEWGEGIWGVGDASRYYFRRAPADLGLFESSFLAALLPAPRVTLTARNRVRAFRLQRNLLTDLLATRLIEQADFSSVFNRINLLHLGLQSGEPITAALRRQVDSPIDDGSSVRALEVRELLNQECGLTWSEDAQSWERHAANAQRASPGVAYRAPVK